MMFSTRLIFPTYSSKTIALLMFMEIMILAWVDCNLFNLGTHKLIISKLKNSYYF